MKRRLIGGVLAGLVLAALVADHDVRPAGHADVDPHVVELALVVVAMGRLDHHATAGDVAEVGLQLLGPFPHPGLDRLGGVHVAKADLYGNVHPLPPFLSRHTAAAPARVTRP